MTLENPYILLFMDHFGCNESMFAITVAKFTVEGTANILANSGKTCPPSSTMGLNHRSQLATAVSKLASVHKLTRSAYNPRGIGGFESVNHNMAHMLVVVCKEHQNDWTVHLPYVEYACYNSTSATTGLVLNDVHTGGQVHLPPIVSDRSYGGADTTLNSHQLAYYDLAREREQLPFKLVRVV